MKFIKDQDAYKSSVQLMFDHVNHSSGLKLKYN